MVTELFGIEVPHQRQSETSAEAASKAQKGFGKNMVKVLRAIEATGSAGMTDDEGQTALGMEGNSYRPSRVTLEKRGLVTKTSITRLTKHRRRAAVYIATMLGKMELTRHDD